MLFGNPVRQARIRPPGSPSLAGNFRVTQDFGPTSLAAEPSLSWGGGEGYAAGYYAHFHKGLDLSDAKCGGDAVATQKGKVRFAGKLADGNICVIIDHGGGWQSAIGHLASESVSVGQGVVKGQKIGTIGATGNASGCHEHFMVKSDVSPNNAISFFANSNGKLRDPWPRLEQNVTIAIRDNGINVRVSAGSSTTPAGAVFASTEPDGTLRRKSDGVNLGPFSQQRAWGGTVTGASYTLAGVVGKTWEKISIEGKFYYVATPLAALSAS